MVRATLIALIPLALLAVVGLWAVVAIGATVVVTAAVAAGPLLRRQRAAPPAPAQGRILEGEAKRIEGD